MARKNLTPEERRRFEEYLESRGINEDKKNLILHNDEINTFKHVIVTLMHICDHNPLQAEQCAMLVHHNGKCHIKSGSDTEIQLMKERLIANDLTVTVE
jgi:ATP-dependent Clp protease adaptor protein ClpS